MSDKNQIKAVLEKHSLTIETVFVPWSQSRNSGEKFPSLNWRVTLKRGGEKILSTDYSAGCAHAPSYQQRETVDSRDSVLWECENGFKVFEGSIGRIKANKKPLQPDSVDVVYSLLMDSEVLEYSSFEEWAGAFGYDPDSRSGEKIYKACLEIALQFRRIGESVISELREVYQDY